MGGKQKRTSLKQPLAETSIKPRSAGAVAGGLKLKTLKFHG